MYRLEDLNLVGCLVVELRYVTVVAGVETIPHFESLVVEFKSVKESLAVELKSIKALSGVETIPFAAFSPNNTGSNFLVDTKPPDKLTSKALSQSQDWR